MLRLAGLKFQNVDRSPGALELVVSPFVERPQANTETEIRFSAQSFYQRQNNLADCNRIFACLNVNIANRRRAMVNQHFGDLFMSGPVSTESPIVATHPAVHAILAAKIRDLDHAADKDLVSEISLGGGGSP